MKHKKILLLLFLSLLICRWATAGQLERWSGLKNIKKLGFELVYINEDASKVELTKDRIETIIELTLRREGIEIEEAAEKSTTIPLLCVNIHLVENVFCIRLEVIDIVHMIRRPDKSGILFATIWKNTSFGKYGYNPQHIISSLSELLESFLNDYYKANPKKQNYGGKRKPKS